jgi:predicted PurR-regulated permease PerM
VSTIKWQRVALIGVAVSAAVFLGACLWFVVGILAPVLGLFFGGWLLACLQEPLVTQVMCRTRASRPTAVGATVVALFVLLVVAAVLIAPTLGRELGSSMLTLPIQLDAARQQALGEQMLVNVWLTQHGVPLHMDLASNESLDSVVQQVLGALPGPLSVVSGAAGAVGSVGMMLLLSVFFLLGGPPLAEEVIHTFDGQAAADVRYVLTAVHDAFEGFLRAQFLQAALYAAGVWACLEVAHVGPAPLVSVVAGVMILVPVVGAALAVAVPLLATLLLNPDAALPVAVAVVLLEQLVLNVVGPRLMGKQLGLPPLVVLFGILAGGQIGGFWGAIFGIPVLATLQMCLGYFRPRWTASET